MFGVLAGVVFQNVFLKFVSPRAAVIALLAFERLILEMYALVSNEMTFLNESSATRGTDVRTDGQMTSGVGRQLRPTRR